MSRIVKANVVAGATVYTDGLPALAGLKAAGYRHIALKQPLRSALRKGAGSVVPLADRVVGNLQNWLIGTHHGVSRAQLSDDLAANMTDAGNKSSDAASHVVARAEHWSENTAGKLEELISSHRDQLSHIEDASAQDRVRDLILAAYEQYDAAV